MARKSFQHRELTSQNRGCTAPNPSSSCSTCSTNRLRSVIAVLPGLACMSQHIDECLVQTCTRTCSSHAWASTGSHLPMMHTLQHTCLYTHVLATKPAQAHLAPFYHAFSGLQHASRDAYLQHVMQRQAGSLTCLLLLALGVDVGGSKAACGLHGGPVLSGGAVVR